MGLSFTCSAIEYKHSGTYLRAEEAIEKSWNCHLDVPQRVSQADYDADSFLKHLPSALDR